MRTTKILQGLSVAFLVGCSTNYSTCHSVLNNFTETFQCIKKTQISGYAKSVQEGPWLTNEWKCGETLSVMTSEKKISDQEAWILFSRASQNYSSGNLSYKCVDEAWLKKRKDDMEAAQKKHGDLNN